MNVDKWATNQLARWEKEGLSRHLETFRSGQEAISTIGSSEFGLFSSSNYLGLSAHSRVIEAASRALKTFGIGTGGSRLTTGTTSLHSEVEVALAQFLGFPDATLFASGYDANVSTLQALAGPDLTIISDRKNHASIIDGCSLAKARGAVIEVVNHRDARAIEGVLKNRRTERALVVTDGLFSMDGTVARVPELMRICSLCDAALMIDDAHAIGTLGIRGRGSTEYWNPKLSDQPDIVVATASKALGSQGGFVASTPAVTRLLRQQARSFAFSTSLSASTCAAILAALELLQESTDLVRRLRENARLMRVELGLTDEYSGPIVPIPVGDERIAVRVAEQLRARGWFVPAIRWPSVPRGQAIIRATVMATHTERQIRAFAADVRAAIRTS